MDFCVKAYTKNVNDSVPVDNYVVSVQVPDGFDASTIYFDGIPKQTYVQSNAASVDLGMATAKTAVMYKYNENGVPIDMYVWTLEYKNHAYEVTPQPEFENLLSYHGFSIRITGKSGIRVKSGIDIDTRARLLSSAGVNGYHLVEYGILAMTDSNRAQYPMVVGGTKVRSSIAYGQKDGALVDAVFEVKDNRYRFTSVLVGLPASQYKTQFAFRSYAVVEKDGQQITLYGPIVARSIYDLAQQALGTGKYAEGSSAEVFLRNIISEAY